MNSVLQWNARYRTARGVIVDFVQRVCTDSIAQCILSSDLRLRVPATWSLDGPSDSVLTKPITSLYDKIGLICCDAIL